MWYEVQTNCGGETGTINERFIVNAKPKTMQAWSLSQLAKARKLGRSIGDVVAVYTPIQLRTATGLAAETRRNKS